MFYLWSKLPSYLKIFSFCVPQVIHRFKIGFVAFAADVYGKGLLYKTREEGFAALNEYRNARSTLLRGRLLAALNFVKSLPTVDHQKVSTSLRVYKYTKF